MKITKEMLKELIKEELENLEEMGNPMMPEDEEENEGHGGEDHDDDKPDMSKEEIVEKMEMLLDMLKDMI
jgi:hypothetical protein